MKRAIYRFDIAGAQPLLKEEAIAHDASVKKAWFFSKFAGVQKLN